MARLKRFERLRTQKTDLARNKVSTTSFLKNFCTMHNVRLSFCRQNTVHICIAYSCLITPMSASINIFSVQACRDMFIGVFGTEFQCRPTSSTAACPCWQFPKFPAANISVRPAVANGIFRGFVAAHLAPAGFLRRRSDGLELAF